MCMCVCVCMCLCVCERASARTLRIVSMDKILHFTNTLVISSIIIMHVCVSGRPGEDRGWNPGNHSAAEGSGRREGVAHQSTTAEGRY